MVCFSSVAWSRTFLDGSVLRHQLDRGSESISGSSAPRSETGSLHQDRGHEREFIPPSNFRLARRYEVPVMRDVILAGNGQLGQSIPPRSPSMVRGAARQANTGASRRRPAKFPKPSINTGCSLKDSKVVPLKGSTTRPRNTRYGDNSVSRRRVVRKREATPLTVLPQARCAL